MPATQQLCQRRTTVAAVAAAPTALTDRQAAASRSPHQPDGAAIVTSSLDGYRCALAGALERLGVATGPEALDLAAAFAAQCNGLWLQHVVEPAPPHDAALAEACRTWSARLGSAARG